MSGNPLMKYLPWVRKNAVFLYLGLGLILYLKRMSIINNTYNHVYSKNDFERRYHLEKIEEYLENKH
jgi:hypothetical protein